MLNKFVLDFLSVKIAITFFLSWEILTTILEGNDDDDNDVDDYDYDIDINDDNGADDDDDDNGDFGSIVTSRSQL